MKLNNTVHVASTHSTSLLQLHTILVRSRAPGGMHVITAHVAAVTGAQESTRYNVSIANGLIATEEHIINVVMVTHAPDWCPGSALGCLLC